MNLDTARTSVFSLMTSFTRSLRTWFTLEARKRLIAEGCQIPDPAVICAEVGIGLLLQRYYKEHGLEDAYLFYDRNEPFIKSIKRRFREYYEAKKRDPRLKNEFWDRIGDVQDTCMQKRPPIQAGAWPTRRSAGVTSDNVYYVNYSGNN